MLNLLFILLLNNVSNHKILNKRLDSKVLKNNNILRAVVAERDQDEQQLPDLETVQSETSSSTAELEPVKEQRRDFEVISLKVLNQIRKEQHEQKYPFRTKLRSFERQFLYGTLLILCFRLAWIQPLNVDSEPFQIGYYNCSMKAYSWQKFTQSTGVSQFQFTPQNKSVSTMCLQTLPLDIRSHDRFRFLLGMRSHDRSVKMQQNDGSTGSSWYQSICEGDVRMYDNRSHFLKMLNSILRNMTSTVLYAKTILVDEYDQLSEEYHQLLADYSKIKTANQETLKAHELLLKNYNALDRELRLQQPSSSDNLLETNNYQTFTVVIIVSAIGVLILSYCLKLKNTGKSVTPSVDPVAPSKASKAKRRGKTKS